MWKCLSSKSLIEIKQKLDIWKGTLNITNFYFNNGCIGKILVAYQKKIKKKNESNPFKNLQSPFLLNPIFKRFFWSNLPSLDPLFYKWGSEFYLLHSEGGNLIYYKEEWKYGFGVGQFERVEETYFFVANFFKAVIFIFILLLGLCRMFKNHLSFSFSSTPSPHHFYWW